MAKLAAGMMNNRWWLTAAALALFALGVEYRILESSREAFSGELATVSQLPAKASGNALEARASLPVLPPLEHFRALTERPPFVPNRRPAMPAPASAAQSAEEVELSKRWKVVGIVMTPDQTHAVLSERRGGCSVSVSVGMSLAGWRVVAVEAQSVRFSSGDQLVTLELHPAEQNPSQTKPTPRSQFHRGGAFTPR